MMKIVILGSGGAVPSPARSLPSIGIRYFGEVYLFDCGEGTQRQMMIHGMSYSRVKMIFLTHLHADHFLGIAGLMQTLKMNERKEPLFIFGPAGTERCVSSILMGAYPFQICIKEIDENFSLKNEKFKISAFKTSHNVRSIGYVFQENDSRNFNKAKADRLGIKGSMFRKLEREGEIAIGKKKVKLEDVTKPKKGMKLVYSGDTLPCKEVLLASKGADLLIHDGTFSEQHREDAANKMHSTVSQAAELAKKARVKNLVLVHLSNRYKDAAMLEKEAKKIFKNSKVAFDGMEICV
ncbi:MAG: ribonuclease Z [Candidatus Micrarchaeota archaeon]|nr:ribonuclease Z [Candidatus Micrarchaeota archaeon]